MLGNVLIISLICLISHLQTPMYFFLCNLSVQDIIYISDTLPKFLAITKSRDHGITFLACITQMFIFVFCIGTEFLLLTSMAYDRYVAICVPLHYAVIMKKPICVLFASVSWLIGFFNALVQSVMLLYSEYCSFHDIDHFYCDLKSVIKLASSDTTSLQTYMLMTTYVLGIVPFFFILASYICIISTITKMHSSGVKVKAFSSCSSHLIVVLLFCVPLFGSYTIPQSEHSQPQDKMLSLLYTALVPLLNPLVYTLRNKDILRAIRHLKKIFGTKSPTLN
ncbi:olfactory receptor 5V1-like [Pyxicephalus adspersus]